ncbi:MAG TPA: phosphohistidine phosphatase SixA [Verrucomicrobiae bacterium]|nr:phosphohistidine phosphatase SixA [Verrucomicrobiae bacterium]
MRLYFLRHGVAPDRETWKGSDEERPLTQAGRERIAREAKRIAQLGLGIEAIVTSPLLRARQTAEIAARKLDLTERLAQDERLALSFDEARLAEVLASYAGVGSLLLVGHEPSMSRTIGRIVGGAAIELKKGALAGIELAGLHPPRGTLLLLAPPKLLSR